LTRTIREIETGELRPGGKPRRAFSCSRFNLSPACSSRPPVTHTTFQPGQSGNSVGRPKGARGKAAIFAQGPFEGEAEEIIRAAVKMAKAGEVGAIRVAPLRFPICSFWREGAGRV
jgi:hypothetical protein